MLNEVVVTVGGVNRAPTRDAIHFVFHYLFLSLPDQARRHKSLTKALPLPYLIKNHQHHGNPYGQR